MSDREGYWQRFNGRIARRRLLQGMALGGAGAAIAAAVGCGGDEGGTKGAASPGAKSDTPQRGGSVRVVYLGESPTYDPHNSPAATPNITGTGGIYDKLMRFDPKTLTLKANVVTKWEFPDPTTLVLTLRDGVKFFDKPPANGRIMTSQDVVYSTERARTPAPTNLTSVNYDRIDSVAAPDAKTVRIKLKSASASILTYLASTGVMNRESIEAIGGVIKEPTQAISVGPFMGAEFQAGVGGKLVRNPNYWDTGKPYLDGLEWSQIVDRGALIAAYRTGDIGFGTIYAGAADGNERKQLERTNSKIQFVQVPDPNPTMFLVQNDKPPFNDLRVRQAIDLVTDRQQLVELVRAGAATPYAQPVWDGYFPGYGVPDSEMAKRPGYRQPKDEDIAEAKKLLAAAGFPNGMDLPADGTEFVSWLNLDAVTASVPQFAKAGIKLHIDKLIDRPTFTDLQIKGQALFRSHGVAGPIEPGAQLRTRYYSTAPRNYMHYKNAEVDAGIDKQDQILNEAERKALCVQIGKKILDDVATVHTFWAWEYIVMQPNLRGVEPVAVATYGDVSEWWLAKA